MVSSARFVVSCQRSTTSESAGVLGKYAQTILELLAYSALQL